MSTNPISIDDLRTMVRLDVETGRLYWPSASTDFTPTTGGRAMQRITHNLSQGSDAWNQHRISHFNASDAPAMMGASKHRSRADLLREKATGITTEVAEATQRLFDAGHAAEAAIRPVIELAISDELYPVTMSANINGLRLSASLDGLSFDGDTILEVKLWNEELAEQVRAGELDAHYYWQLEQQLLCSGAERVIFATGDGAEKLATMEYRAVPGRADALIAGWLQFERDLAAYKPEPAEAPKPIGRTPETLPSLRIEARGMVTASNLGEFKAHAMAVLGSINRTLKTDEDFADAEKTVKWCGDVEDRLEAAKANVLGQMADVDAVCRTIDDVAAETRRIRLELDKLVRAEKESRKGELVRAGINAVVDFYGAINRTLAEHALPIPATLNAEIGASIKGLKTLSSMRDKIDAAVAAAKINASQQAEKVRENLAVFATDDAWKFAHLFPDRVQLCRTKQPEDLAMLVAHRIAEHQKREEERERARQQREVEEAERLREQIRMEEEAKARAEFERGQAILREEEQNVRREDEERKATPAAPVRIQPKPAAPESRIKLGDLNLLIAPITVTADGLSTLGFEPACTERSAKLYSYEDLPAIFASLKRVICVAETTTQRADLRREAA